MNALKLQQGFLDSYQNADVVFSGLVHHAQSLLQSFDFKLIRRLPASFLEILPMNFTKLPMTRRTRELLLAYHVSNRAFGSGLFIEGESTVRRKDREMPEAFAFEIFDKAAYAVVGFCEEQGPYTVALSLVRIGRRLYFHSAQAGRKVDLARTGRRVSVTAVGDVEIPDASSQEDLDLILADPSRHGLFGKLVFTTSFESAHASGPILEIHDDDEKVAALRALCEKYTPEKMAYFDAAIATSLKSTAVFAIELEDIHGKRKRPQSLP